MKGDARSSDYSSLAVSCAVNLGSRCYVFSVEQLCVAVADT